MSDGVAVGTFPEMKRWLAIILPLSLLGQTPNNSAGTEPVAPLPRTDELDPATREQRDAVEAARDDADTFQTPGVTPMYPQGSPAPDATASGPEVGFGGSGTATGTPATGADTGTTGTPAAGTGTGAGATGAATATGTGTRAPTPGTTATGGTAGQQPATGTGTAAAQPSPPKQPTPEEMAEQLQELRSQVQTLEQQLAAREEQLAQNEETTAGLQQNLGAIQSNAQELERLRQQRLAQIQSAWGWLVAADNALAQGELAVDEALRQADLVLGDALENASVTGRAETVQLMQNARSLVGSARTAVDNRDVYNARLSLQSAGQSLGQAQSLSLARPDVSVVTPPPAQ